MTKHLKIRLITLRQQSSFYVLNRITEKQVHAEF
jgi:hypothetical protein